MAEGKKSFIAYADWIYIFEELPDDEAGKLVKHLFKYVNDENPEAPSLLIRALFAPMKSTLKRDLKKWDKYIEKQRNNGKKGGRPKKPKKPNPLQENPSQPKKPVSVSVSDSVSVTQPTKVGESKLSGEALKLYQLKQREIKFRKEVNKLASDELPGDEVMKFCDYWTEPNKSKTKLKFELQKTWETSRRLKTWMNRANEYKRNHKHQEITEAILNMKNPYDD